MSWGPLGIDKAGQEKGFSPPFVGPSLRSTQGLSLPLASILSQGLELESRAQTLLSLLSFTFLYTLLHFSLYGFCLFALEPLLDCGLPGVFATLRA